MSPATAGQDSSKKDVMLSEVDDMMLEQMVQRASTPNLATLLRAGKKAGLIKPVQQYGDKPAG